MNPPSKDQRTRGSIDVEQADVLISELTRLADSLWATYGAQIVANRQRELTIESEHDQPQASLDFDDTLPF